MNRTGPDEASFVEQDKQRNPERLRHRTGEEAPVNLVESYLHTVK